MKGFEDENDTEMQVIYSDIIKEKEVKPEMKILSKVLKSAKFNLRKDHKRTVKKKKFSKPS